MASAYRICSHFGVGFSRVNTVPRGPGYRLHSPCKVSPDIACIPRRDDAHQNENGEEGRGGTDLHSMTEMKGFGPFSFKRATAGFSWRYGAGLLIGLVAPHIRSEFAGGIRRTSAVDEAVLGKSSDTIGVFVRNFANSKNSGSALGNFLVPPLLPIRKSPFIREYPSRRQIKCCGFFFAIQRDFYGYGHLSSRESSPPRQIITGFRHDFEFLI